MSRRRYLFTYDVSDDRRRTRIFQVLRDHGDHVQYSVFLCDLNQLELTRLRGELIEETHSREDQVLILDLGDAAHPVDTVVECIGRAFVPPVRVLVV